ncbi:type II/IV secretion system ATPase subunit [Candidatus Woesearchaeota archaeon]|nr:type II/IV secretion system ATPase subunit [Candidatus Woesearchaeota archaeon]
MINFFKRSKKLPQLHDKAPKKFEIQSPTKPVSFPKVPKDQVDIRYPLLEPYAYAHIKWDNEAGELVYSLEEPHLEVYEKKVLNLLEEGIKELLNISYLASSSGETVIQYLEKNVKALISELRIKIGKESYMKIMYYIYRDFVGLGKVEPLMNDYYIEDIECNGTGYPIYVVHRNYRNMRTNVLFEKTPVLSNFVEKLAQRTGQYISYANPLLDGALPDGSRVNATYTEDISSRGPTFTIRKFTKVPWTPVQLIKLGTISPEILAYLWMVIEHEQNVMIIGGTGSGKTTMLNGLTFFIPPQARIVSIEDTRELNLEHDNWLPSVARGGVGLSNLVGQKYGEVTLFNLLKESFRQNPDYVIIGEIRGEEAYVLFQGMASGHPSFGTMHADSVDTMIKRLKTPPINLSSSLVETMDVVLVMSNVKLKGKSVRRLREVVEVLSVKEDATFKTNKPFVWDPTTDGYNYVSASHVFQKITKHSGVPAEQLQAEFIRRSKLIHGLYSRKIFGFHDVQQVINDYYKDPDGTTRTYGV